MKKHFIKVAAFAAVAFVAGYGVYTSQQSGEMSDIGFSDIEALANNEKGCVNGPNCCGYCFYNDGIYSCESYWILNCVTAVN